MSCMLFLKQGLCVSCQLWPCSVLWNCQWKWILLTVLYAAASSICCSKSFKAAVPNLFGTRNWFLGRQFFPRTRGWAGDGFGKLQAHYIDCVLHFFPYLHGLVVKTDWPGERQGFMECSFHILKISLLKWTWEWIRDFRLTWHPTFSSLICQIRETSLTSPKGSITFWVLISKGKVSIESEQKENWIGPQKASTS